MKINRFKSAFQYGINRSVTLPYAGVPQEAYVVHGVKDFLSIWKKFLHRWLLLLIHRQRALMCDAAPPNGRVLFIYHGVNNFGDAIMDLSGRVLLKERRGIDLLLSPEISSLFMDDDVFDNVFTNIDDVNNIKYDFIILNTLGVRSIKFKAKYFKNISFSCVSGHMMHVDYNHIQLGFIAINSLFKIGFTTAALLTQSKPYLPHSSKTRSEPHNPKTTTKPYIVIALGGRDPLRTYAHWDAVLRLLDENIEFARRYDVFFIGSANAQSTTSTLMQMPWQHIQPRSFVNTLDFLGNQLLIAHSALFIGADGGLMHLAHTTNTPSVTLFDAGVNPGMRLTPACQSISIQSDDEVSRIDPKNVYTAIIGQIFSSIPDQCAVGRTSP